jgi:hypothetical protein
MQLPDSAMEFARILGIGATLRLADCAKSHHRDPRKRSYRIRIPSGPMDDSHPLVRTLGREDAEIVHRQFAGETMPFPARRIRALARDIAIAREFEQGIPLPVIAQAHGVSERTATRALDRISHGDIQRAGLPSKNITNQWNP